MAVEVACRDCGRKRNLSPRAISAYKHFDPETMTTLCRSCFMKRWHVRTKKLRGRDGYDEMLRRRMLRARKTMPRNHQEMGAAARRGITDPMDRIIRRALSKRTHHLVNNRYKFFICSWCGKLSSCHVNETIKFGLGCFREFRKTEDWAEYIRQRKFVDKAYQPDWANKSKRYPRTLKEDLLIVLEHYILLMTIPEIAKSHALTEIAVKKAVQRCRAVLPDTWGHVFPDAKGAVRDAPIAF